MEILRLHHGEALRHWRRRFASGWDRITEHHDPRSCRMWELYLALSEAAFRRGGLMVFQIQLARRVDAVPLTRGYLHERLGAGAPRLGVAA